MVLDFTNLNCFKTVSRAGDPDEQVCKFCKSLDRSIKIVAILAPSQNTRVLYWEPNPSESKFPKKLEGMDKELREQALGKKVEFKKDPLDTTINKKVDIEKNRKL